MARIFLAMNGKKINSLDDLRLNFNGKQMLDFYRAGRLQKWLEELGQYDLLETIQSFLHENYDNETLLSMLMAAFELDNDQIAEVKKTVQDENKTDSEHEEYSLKMEKEEYPEPETIYTETELEFLAIKRKVYNAIKQVVKESNCLTYKQRQIEPQWTMSFQELYGKDFYDFGIDNYFTYNPILSKQKLRPEQCLIPISEPRDFNTPLGVLEAVLLRELKECVNESYGMPAKLHVRYMELLEK